MRDFWQEYFALIQSYNRAVGLQRDLLKLSTQLSLQELSREVPSSSRLYREVNKYLNQNFFQPGISTQ